MGFERTQIICRVFKLHLHNSCYFNIPGCVAVLIIFPTACVFKDGALPSSYNLEC